MTSRFVVAFLGLAALSSPTLAGNPYLGIEGGSTFGRSNDVDETVEYRTTPTSSAAPRNVKYDDVFGVQYKRGTDLDLVAGYDFGWFRLEGELARKRLGLKRNVNDDITDQFLEELNSALRRPSEAPDPDATGLPALTIADFQPSGTLKVRSAMVNGLLDLRVADRLTASAGGGIGRSFARGFDDHDGALAWQYVLGGRYVLDKHIEIGLKYRYFNSGIIKLDHDSTKYRGNPQQSPLSGTQTTNAIVAPDIEGEFRSRSLLVGFVYNVQ
jgi:opacity protein-like surface antigen